MRNVKSVTPLSAPGVSPRSLDVLIAPDSFKGSISAADAAAALASGWLTRRPADRVRILPLADGGEGTLEVLAGTRDARWITARVPGPLGCPVTADWLLLADGTAVVEMARSSGLTLCPKPDAMRASTYGLGELVCAALDKPGTERLIVTLGGSATTDAGTGALTALGARFLDGSGTAVRPGGGGLLDLVRIDLSGLREPPPDGVRCLVDVDSPLLGPRGAAHRFARQKGASDAEVAALERALTRFSTLVGDPGEIVGAGAAGGTAYGLSALWNAELTAGAPVIAGAVGLPDALCSADVVLTGEGCFDEQSLGGKVVGHLLAETGRHRIPTFVVAGQILTGTAGEVTAVSLTELAGAVEPAVADAGHWLRRAGAQCAASWSGSRVHP